MSRPIIVVQGGQYGSESKGAIAAHLAAHRYAKVAVRTGAINAGHTVYYKGKPYKMQQLPTAWVVSGVKLVIGPGAYIHPATLSNEVAQIATALGVPMADVIDRIAIDYRCAVHTESNERSSEQSNRHHLMGATGKGCSQAIVSKINERGRNSVLFRDTIYSGKYRLMDTVEYLHGAYDEGDQILIEGTQGHELDLHQGPWPYTTSRMTTSANWVAEAGLSPSMEYSIVLVVRTFPIRVAGNSGPLPNEISWPELGRHILNKKGSNPNVPLFYEEDLTAFERAVTVAARRFSLPEGSDGNDQHKWSEEHRVKYRVTLSELNASALNLLAQMEEPTYERLINFFELTTVTRKLRRIGQIDTERIRKVARLERASSLAVTFLNYDHPYLWGRSTNIGDAVHWLGYLERKVGVPPMIVNTGNRPEHIIDAQYW